MMLRTEISGKNLYAEGADLGNQLWVNHVLGG
jgi:hypothetical protein